MVKKVHERKERWNKVERKWYEALIMVISLIPQSNSAEERIKDRWFVKFSSFINVRGAIKGLLSKMRPEWP